MKRVIYISIPLVLILSSCIKIGKGPNKTHSKSQDHQSRLDSLVTITKFNEWCEFYLVGKEGTLNYLEVMSLHKLISSEDQKDYLHHYNKTDILGRYFLDETNKDTLTKIYNLCVADFSDDFEIHLICRIQKGPEWRKSYLISQKRFYHGNYPCSDSWERGKFNGFGRIGKQFYYFGHNGTGSGYCSEGRIILNSNCEEIGPFLVPWYVWSYYETGFVDLNARWSVINDSTLNVYYLQESGYCLNPYDVFCDIEKMKTKKSREFIQFKLRQDTVICSDTAAYYRLWGHE